MFEDKRTVLVVDDEKETRRLMRACLEVEGLECFEAQDGAEALAYLKSNPVNVVLLDIQMPGQSGLEVLPEIRAGFPLTVVIMITAITDADTAIDCLRSGAYDYIIKPFGIDEMAHSVKRAMEKSLFERELKMHRHHLEQKVEAQAQELHQNFLGAIAALSFAQEAKDCYTAGHTRRVSEIAMAIGRRMNLGPVELEDLKWGSLLHDIGKIAINPAIINKEDKLTVEEYEHIMTHPVVGASIVSSVIKNKKIVEVIEHHHAWYNGHGQNQSLYGEDLPLLARIVSVADAYDAMTSNRPYRQALAREEALAEIWREANIRFDPGIVDLLLNMSADEITSRKKTVLVADDEESIRLLIRSALGNEYNVVEACNGLMAVEMAIATEPSIILMDILMPEKDGLRACYELKSNPQTRGIPILMLTGINQALNRQLSENLGADGYITKPFDLMELLETVARHCRAVPACP